MGGSGPPGAGSGWSNAAELLTKLAGVGIASQGGALGPVLLGIGSTLEGRRTAARDAAANEAILHMIAPFAGTTTIPRVPGTPASRLAAGEDPEAAAFIGATPGTGLPERQESFVTRPPQSEIWRRAGAANLQEPVRGRVLDFLTQNVTHFPKDVEVPAEVAEARTRRGYEAGFAGAHPGVDPSQFSDPASRAARFEPPVPKTHVTSDGRIITEPPPGTGEPSAREVLTPRQEAEQKRYGDYRRQVQALVEEEARSGKPIPPQRWRGLITQYGDVVPKDDPVRQHLGELDKEEAAMTRERFRQGRIDARAARRGPGTTESVTTKTKPRAPITNLDEMGRIQGALPQIVNDVTARIPGFGARGTSTVTLPSGRVVSKAKILEVAIRQQLGVEARVVWNGRQFQVVQAWEPEQVLESTTTKGPARERDEEEPVAAD